ncbi:MAG: hypothetical protein FWG70_12195 [Oscillospiraceae bacterium]|nr:hypothetical protein [Oscillospiraceae bacterium]
MKKVLLKLLVIPILAAFLLGLAFSASAEAENDPPFPHPSALLRQEAPPDLLTMYDGTPVTTAAQWGERRGELRALLEYYMYGPFRGGEDDFVSYTINGTQTSMSVNIANETASESFDVGIVLPDTPAPAEGYPFFVVFWGMGGETYALEQGYALIRINPGSVATESVSPRGGVFYDLYPYGDTWETQTGNLTALAWGASKVLDALEAGAAEELNLNMALSIINGNSRWGKAAMVTGAFEDRFTVTFPSCSGTGGAHMWRYDSNGLTFNLLPELEGDPNGVPPIVRFSGRQSIDSLSGDANGSWVNNVFKSFSNAPDRFWALPVDAHFLAALTASENRLLFIHSEVNNDWVGTPGATYTHELAEPVFKMLGLENNLAINYTMAFHTTTAADLAKLFAFIDVNINGAAFNIENYFSSELSADERAFLANFKPEDLKTSFFRSPSNIETYESGKPVSAVAEIPEAPETPEPPMPEESVEEESIEIAEGSNEPSAESVSDAEPLPEDLSDLQTASDSPFINTLSIILIIAGAALIVLVFVFLIKKKTKTQ